MKLTYSTLLLSGVLVGLAPKIFATSPCDLIISSTSISTTDELWSTLYQLLESKDLSVYNLNLFYENLLKSKLVNPIAHQDSPYGPLFLNAKDRAHYFRIQKMIDAYLQNEETIDLDQLKIKIGLDLKKRGIEKSKKAEMHQKIKTPFVRMSGIVIPSGTFMMGYDENIVETTLSKSFEIMSHPITQYQWAKIMGSTYFGFRNGEQSILVDINGKMEKLQPDNPAVMINWNEFQEFIAKINTLSDEENSILYDLISDHQKGDRYDFLSEAQIAYVMKKAVTEDNDTIDKMIERNDWEKLKDYAWFSDNSEGITHPVGEKKPLWFMGKPIYDLHGNVWTWTKDNWKEKLPGGVDPVVFEDYNQKHSCRGGSWQFSSISLQSCERNDEKSKMGNVDIGLRLVRIRD